MDITIGIEEELMIIDPATREVITDPGQEIFEHAKRNAEPHNVVTELLRAQIETNSKVCRSVEELDTSLRETRAAVIKAAQSEGASVIASSTHPWARWQDQQVTDNTRYQRAQAVLQDSGRQFFIGGMHVHAGFATPDTRIAAMNAIMRHLPLLLALSTSSPFHDGRLTGLKSYRQSAIAALPRTGLPPTLHSWEEFEHIVRTYKQIGAIKDASELRWDIRPSAHYPTIELRICDICPKVEDAIAIAALYACLIRRAATDIESGAAPANANREVVGEGRWLAQRYGTFAFLPEENVREDETVAELTEKLVEALRPHAKALGCEAHIAHAVEIAQRGSSAERQEDTYREAKLDGASEREALCAVVDQVRTETEAIETSPVIGKTAQ